MISIVLDQLWEIVEGFEKRLLKISTIRIKLRRQSLQRKVRRSQKMLL